MNGMVVVVEIVQNRSPHCATMEATQQECVVQVTVDCESISLLFEKKFESLGLGFQWGVREEKNSAADGVCCVRNNAHEKVDVVDNITEPMLGLPYLFTSNGWI